MRGVPRCRPSARRAQPRDTGRQQSTSARTIADRQDGDDRLRGMNASSRPVPATTACPRQPTVLPERRRAREGERSYGPRPRRERRFGERPDRPAGDRYGQIARPTAAIARSPHRQDFRRSGTASRNRSAGTERPAASQDCQRRAAPRQGHRQERPPSAAARRPDRSAATGDPRRCGALRAAFLHNRRTVRPPPRDNPRPLSNEGEGEARFPLRSRRRRAAKRLAGDEGEAPQSEPTFEPVGE